MKAETTTSAISGISQNRPRNSMTLWCSHRTTLMALSAAQPRCLSREFMTVLQRVPGDRALGLAERGSHHVDIANRVVAGAQPDRAHVGVTILVAQEERCTVLGAREGAIPPRDSPALGAFTRQPSIVQVLRGGLVCSRY